MESTVKNDSSGLSSRNLGSVSNSTFNPQTTLRNYFISYMVLEIRNKETSTLLGKIDRPVLNQTLNTKQTSLSSPVNYILSVNSVVF